MNSTRGVSIRWWLTATLALVALEAASGQANDEINTGTEFNLSTPGARSLALGGAFLAMADDATAAYTNPAGLTQLWEGGREVAAEYRRWNYKSRFADRGRSSGTPLGVGVDSIAGIQEGEASTTASGLSFLSVGMPGPRWSFALFRHELANFKAQFETEGPFVGDLSRINPTSSRIDLSIINTGLAVAHLLDTRFSVGFNLYHSQLDLDAETARFWVRPTTGNPEADRLVGAVFGAPDRLPDNIENWQRQAGDDDDFGWSVGFLWRLSRDRGKALLFADEGEDRPTKSRIWRLGGTYRKGPRFDYQAEYIWGPRAPLRRPGTVPGTLRPGLGGAGVFKVPSVYGLGLAFVSASGVLAISLDVNRVEYSSLSDRIINLLSVAGTGTSFRPEFFQIDDATEVHLGTEYTFARYETSLLANLRFGVWFDPDHRLQYLGNNDRLRARFLAGEDALHFSTGLGLTFRESFQTDIGFDVSKKGSTLSISLVRFW